MGRKYWLSLPEFYANRFTLSIKGHRPLCLRVRFRAVLVEVIPQAGVERQCQSDDRRSPDADMGDDRPQLRVQRQVLSNPEGVPKAADERESSNRPDSPAHDRGRRKRLQRLTNLRDACRHRSATEPAPAPERDEKEPQNRKGVLEEFEDGQMGERYRRVKEGEALDGPAVAVRTRIDPDMRERAKNQSRNDRPPGCPGLSKPHSLRDRQQSPRPRHRQQREQRKLEKPVEKNEEDQADQKIDRRNPGERMIEDVLQPEVVKAEVGKEDRSIRGHAANHQRRKRQPFCSGGLAQRLASNPK